MEALFFCTRWGFADMEWNTFLQKVRDNGYDGVEISLPENEKEKDELLNGIERSGIQWIGQHWETVVPEFDRHCLEYERRLQNLASANPLFINTQTGKDYYSFDQNRMLIEIADRVAAKSGVQIVHETHRGKFSFAAHITKYYIEQLPGLQLTLDISHWCNVAESLLQDQKEAVDSAISRTKHIHARTGHSQGPQVPDPRSAEWEEALEFHLSCWDKIAQQKKEAKEQLTITPEFGPFPYMTHLPFKRTPIADQWQINEYMMTLLKKRYQRF